jgi:hypothetical protein
MCSWDCRRTCSAIFLFSINNAISSSVKIQVPIKDSIKQKLLMVSTERVLSLVWGGACALGIAGERVLQYFYFRSTMQFPLLSKFRFL